MNAFQKGVTENAKPLSISEAAKSGEIKGDRSMKASSHALRSAKLPRMTVLLTLSAIGLALGCQRDAGHSHAMSSKAATPQATEAVSDEIQAALAQLSPEDRQLALAQQYCPVMEDSRLGAMGPPIKLDIKGQAVFICCKGCRSKALREAEKTLAKVAELKARAKK
jgi:hypothetical protein